MASEANWDRAETQPRVADMTGARLRSTCKKYTLKWGAISTARQELSASCANWTRGDFTERAENAQVFGLPGVGGATLPGRSAMR